MGGGGLLGGAWLVGALTALQERIGEDPRSADVIVGTSVGALYSSLLASGVAVADLLAHQLGETITSGPLVGVAWDYDTDVVAAGPAMLRGAPGSTRLLASNVRRLRELPATTLVSALVPNGRGSLDRVGELIDTVAGGPWVSRRNLRLTAVDYDSGARVVFTGPGEVPVMSASVQPGSHHVGVDVVTDLGVGAAVMASCAVPGWFPPVTVGGRRYVDGGVWSPTSVDLLRDDHLDEVFVLSPLVSFAKRRTRTLREAVDWQWRQAVTRGCMREAGILHAVGTRVTVLGPDGADLDAIGADVMDSSRRLPVLVTSLTSSRASLRAPERIGASR